MINYIFMIVGLLIMSFGLGMKYQNHDISSDCLRNKMVVIKEDTYACIRLADIPEGTPLDLDNLYEQKK